MVEGRHAEAGPSPLRDSTVAAGGVRGLLRAATFHYGRLLGNGTALGNQVQAALAARPDETVVDVGCGTGGLARCVPGAYLGIDVDPDYVAFARLRFAGAMRRFELVRLEDLPADRRFDKAMVVNCIHHLSDPYLRWMLDRLSRTVRTRVVIADLDPETANPLQAFLLACDRGDHIRPVAMQRALIEERFRIVEERRFPNSPHTVVQVLFVCEPKP